MIKGNVRKIIKFSAVDGPGNRTSIFLQGCNFNCAFCHNPETISIQNGASREMSAEEIFEEIGSARKFIRGITVSGGECTLQRDFLLEILKLAKENNLETYLDSNGSYDFSLDEKLMEYTDMVMLDVKSIDNDEHIKITGESNDIVLKNLKFLAENNKLFEIRTVVTIGLLHNEKTVNEASKLIAPYKSIRYKLIKYRPMGVRKKYVRDYKVPSNDYMNSLKELAEKNVSLNIVII